MALHPTDLSLVEGIVLGIIEGVTEFLPISSTGHLTVAARLLDLRGTAVDSYVIAVQIGAIAAVLALYRQRIRSLADAGRRPFRRGPARGVLVALAVAFVPAALVGAVLGDVVKDRLFGVGPVAAAWAVGGVAILVFARRGGDGHRPLEAITVRDGIVVGLAQVLALWPGTSRSLVTILAAVTLGLSLPAAVEFSFLLGLVTLTAATGFELARHGGEIVDAFGYLVPAVGVVVAFASALVSIRWMVAHLQSRGFELFGWYRLLAAAGATALLLLDVV